MRPLAPFSAEQWWLLALVFGLGSWLRLHDLAYNTIFLDESTNVLVGRAVLRGELTPSPIPVYIGWYLFPLMSWWADQWGGVVGMRTMTGLLGVGALAAVVHTTRRLFGRNEAVAAAALLVALSPLVQAGRVAFREAGTISFLAIGIACFVEAMADGRRRYWVLSALCVFAAFLCKHPIGMYGPPMVLVAWFTGPVARRWFSVLLTLLVLTYVAIYWKEMLDMLAFLRSFAALKAPSHELAQIYGWQRLDVWACLLLSVIAFVLDQKTMWRARWVMFGGALLFAAVSVAQRTDYLQYKQAAYVLLLLAPLAVHALSLLLQRAGANSGRALLLTATIVMVPLALAGRNWHPTRADVGLSWPNNGFFADYLRAWPDPTRKVLVDDQTLRYELWPLYRSDQLADAFAYAYHDSTGALAYRAAVRDGEFDFILLNGSAFGSSTDLRNAITPVLAARYALIVDTQDSATAGPMQIFRRVSPRVTVTPVVDGRLIISEPGSDARVGETVVVRGELRSPRRGGERVQVDVYTNRWWPQGNAVDVDPLSGLFEVTATLGGTGIQQCHHIIRARAYDARGGLIATTTVTEVARVNSESAGGSCEAR